MNFKSVYAIFIFHINIEASFLTYTPMDAHSLCSVTSNNNVGDLSSIEKYKFIMFALSSRHTE